MAIAADRKSAGAENPGLLAPDVLARWAQIVDVIDRDRGDDGDVGIDHIDRIEPAAEADFEHQHVDSRAREQPERGERAELEIRERRFHARSLDRGERFQERIVARLRSIDAHALVVAQEMRRRIEPDAVAARAQHGFEERAGRSLAVGAADGEYRACRRDVEAVIHRADAVEPHRDRLGMQRAEIREPLGQRRECCHRFTAGSRRLARGERKDRFSPRAAAVAAAASEAWATRP